MKITHFIMMILVMITFSCKSQQKICEDSDNDGICDSIDDCPLIKGNEKNNGCPDFDSDNYKDCPYRFFSVVSGEINIDKKELAKKECIINDLKKYKLYNFSIIGYATDGNNENESTGLKRAIFLKEYLVDSIGINSNRIMVKTKGSKFPIFLDKKRNNRVEVQIINTSN